MLRPYRARNICLHLSLLAAITGLGAIALGDPPASPALQTALGLAALCVFPLAFIGLVNYQVETIRYNRLLAGHDVIARWHLTPQRWTDFLRLNTALNARGGHAPCLVPHADRPRPNGVDVIVGKASVLIDGDFHSLPRRGFTQINGPFWIDGPPPCIEFHLTTHSENSSYRDTLRVPIAEGAEGDATIVYDHYTAHIPQPKRRNNRLFRNVSIVVALVSGAAAAAVLLNVPYFNEHRDYQLHAMITAIVGTLVCPAALLLAIVAHFRLRADADR